MLLHRLLTSIGFNVLYESHAEEVDIADVTGGVIGIISGDGSELNVEDHVIEEVPELRFTQ